MHNISSVLLYIYIHLKEPGVKLTPRNTDDAKCVGYRTLKKISAGQFYVYRVGSIKLGKVIKSEAK